MKLRRQLNPVEAEWRELTDELGRAVAASLSYTSYFSHLRFGDEAHPFRTHNPRLTFETVREGIADEVGSIFVPVRPVVGMARLVVREALQGEGRDRQRETMLQQLEDERTGLAVTRGGFRRIRRPYAIDVALATIEKPIPSEMEIGCCDRTPGCVIGEGTKHWLSVEKGEFVRWPDGAREGMHGIVNGVHTAIKALYD